ncbi:uncharacterized protein LOC112183795 [Rosa chinensis]|uniref:uncharacterized protein LOC112183795 n=1 Tax=Rosa chinensis TaxID=74649 RepID=UPI000D094BE1|nr:uncharacterized protein LOC112183795 [Rosa chinensis]
MASQSIASRWMRKRFLKKNDIADEKYEDNLIKRVVEERERPIRRGSIKGRIVVPRYITKGHENLYRDYFADPPIFSDNVFRRRFRMRRHVFLRIQNAVLLCDPYFLQKRNAAGAIGLSSYQKITAALRMLAYGVPADYVDEYVRIGESTALKSLKRFVNAVVVMFGDEYLRPPNSNDIARLLSIGEKRGFPGMLGSIDCMHWRWKNCPSAWQGMYSGHYHEPTIILEAVASYDLWIWHAFFGLPGSHNDINVLDRSSLFDDLATGRAPPVNYLVNGKPYNMGYYLADGIYPTWATFVKTIPAPQGNKKKHFAKQQEGARKDVERAFGVLQARFAIVRGPARLWNQETLKDIMTACIIMHNMIVEDERDDDHYIRNIGRDRDSEIDQIIENYDIVGEPSNVLPSHERTQTLMEFIDNHLRIKDGETHSRLQGDLIEHLWQLHGGE